MNIFVARLDYGITDDDLRTAFEAYGEVESAKIIMDRETGRSRGFGFVEMPNDDEGKAAIEDLNGAELNGREIAVKESEPREKRGGGGYGGGGRGGRGCRGCRGGRSGSCGSWSRGQGGGGRSRRQGGRRGSGRCHRGRDQDRILLAATATHSDQEGQHAHPEEPLHDPSIGSGVPDIGAPRASFGQRDLV